MAKTYDFSDFDEPKAQYDFSDFDAPNTSQLESGLRGAAQGATLGFSDEIAGAAGGIWDDISSMFTGEASKDGTYTKHRDESRAANKAAQQANPLTYGAGEIGGSIATAFVPGLNAGKLATLGGRVVGNAGLGALAGLGLSDADNAGDMAKDAALGGALSGGMAFGIEKAAPLIGKAAGYVGGKTGDAANWATKKIGKVGFGVDEKATANYMANRADVNAAPSLGEIADAVLDNSDDSALREMRQKASQMSSNAWDTLGDSGGMSKAELLKAISDAQEALKVKGVVVGKAKRQAFDTLGELSNDFSKFDDNIDQNTLKSIIQDLDDNINWSNPEVNKSNEALTGIRRLTDRTLKGQNKAYEQAMEKTSDVTEATKQVEKVFKNRSQPENYDKFTKQVKNLVNKDDMSAANQAVDKIQEHTGYNLRKDISDSWTKDQFAKGNAQGSRNTLFGALAGGAVGSLLGPVGTTIGSAVGGAAGHSVDKYAGPIFKKLLDGKVTTEEFAQHLAPKLGKYAAPLQNAIQRGGAALGSTIFLLQQNEPEFRKLTSGQ
jgi:hypothetical protein